MPRAPRLELPGVPLHVVQRGNNRAACFLNDIDRRFYLKCLGEAAARQGCAIHAYVLMTNHVHLLTTPPERGAAGAMIQELGRRYVRIFNSLHGRTGTLWEGRFKSSRSQPGTRRHRSASSGIPMVQPSPLCERKARPLDRRARSVLAHLQGSCPSPERIRSPLRSTTRRAHSRPNPTSVKYRLRSRVRKLP